MLRMRMRTRTREKLITRPTIVRILMVIVGSLAIASCAPGRGEQTVKDETIPEGAEQAPPLTAAEARKLALFTEPSFDADFANEVFDQLAGIDPKHEVPEKLLKPALLYYQKNLAHIDNKAYLTIVDFSRYSNKSRMFIVDMSTGEVLKLHVAHGIGSDRQDLGVPTQFSNVVGSNASSLGFYRTAETYDGIHGLSLRLDGLSPTNSNVRERDVVLHGAPYVHDRDVKAGRSAGCLAVSVEQHVAVVNMLKNGSLIFAGTSN